MATDLGPVRATRRKKNTLVLTWPVRVNVVVPLRAAYGLRLGPVVITTL